LVSTFGGYERYQGRPMDASDGSGGAGFDPARLIATHQATIWRYLRALGCDPAEADDLTQETFLRVLRQKFTEVHPAATAAYLRKTAYHLFITARRQLGRSPALDEMDVVELAWSRWVGEGDSEALLESLRECLDELTPRARQALEMRFRDDCSRARIAETLKLTEDGAKNLMQRAKQQLRSCIDAKRS